MSERSIETGKKIRYFRTGKNMTLEELAAAVCKSKATKPTSGKSIRSFSADGTGCMPIFMTAESERSTERCAISCRRLM